MEDGGGGNQGGNYLGIILFCGGLALTNVL